MSDEYERFLQKLHEVWTTPYEILADAVRRASGSEPARRERIVAGEANEVWDVTNADGLDLIVRISHWDTFAAEAWAVRECRRVGVPVPDVLLVEDGVPAGDDKRVAVWVHRRVEGESLLQLREHEDVRDLAVEAGRLLAMVHTVQTSGFGRLDRLGRGAEASWADWLAWDEAAREAVAGAGIASHDIDEVDHWLDVYRALNARTRSGLLHGDWGAVHVLARDGRVVALIDFGNAYAGDAAFDLARWDLVFNLPAHPTDDLIDGYRQVSDLGPELDVRRALCRLEHIKFLAPHFAKDDRAGPLVLMQYRFGEALALLRANA